MSPLYFVGISSEATAEVSTADRSENLKERSSPSITCDSTCEPSDIKKVAIESSDNKALTLTRRASPVLIPVSSPHSVHSQLECNVKSTRQVDKKTPVYFTKNIFPSTQMRQILRPTLHRQVQVLQATSHSMIGQLYPTLAPSACLRRYPYLQTPIMNCEKESHYMISGAPGSSDMKITMVADDATKHSTKERQRR